MASKLELKDLCSAFADVCNPERGSFTFTADPGAPGMGR